MESTPGVEMQGDCLWDVGIGGGDIITVHQAGTQQLGRGVLAVLGRAGEMDQRRRESSSDATALIN